MSDSTLQKLKAVSKILRIIAENTATTLDDKLVAILDAAIENPAVLAVIEAIIEGLHSQPQASVERIYSAIPQHQRDEAEQVCQRIGDGKLIELLVKVGPLLIKLLPLIAIL